MQAEFPQRPSLIQLLTSYNSAAVRWPGALRAALAIIFPGTFALLLGHDDALLILSAGAFTVIYGEGHPLRTRVRVMALASAAITGANITGFLVGTVAFAPGHGHWWLLLPGFYTLFLATVGTFLQNALHLPPPGSFFIVMVGGGSTMLARTDITLDYVALWTVVGCSMSLLIGMLVSPRGPETDAVNALEKATQGFLAADTLARHHRAQTALARAWQTLADAGIVRGGRVIQESGRDLVERTLRAQLGIVRHNQALATTQDSAGLTDNPTDVDPDRTVIPHTRPTARYRIYRAATAHSHATVAAEKVFLAAAATVVIGLALGFNRPDWGAVSALLVLQWGPEHIPGTVRGIQRMVGSALGVALFSAFHFFGVHGWTLMLALAVCQFFAEIFVVKNYALCVIFSTPLALLMGNSATAPLGATLGSRLGEIVVSVSCSLAVLWWWKRNARARDHGRLQRRCVEAMSTLLGLLLHSTPAAELAARRDLHYELLAERRAISSMAVDQPEAARNFWQRHITIQQAGYHVLDFCSTHPDVQPTDAQLRELASHIRTAAYEE